MSDASPSPAKPAMTTDIPVGEILRRTRVHYKHTPQDIESALRIRASQIEAIEQGDLSKLPAQVYAVGFVRSYSEYLGLDGDKMVELFKAQSGGHSHGPDLQFPIAADEASLPSMWLAVGSVVTVLVLIVFLVTFSSEEQSDVNAIPEPPAIQTSMAQQQAAPLPAASAEETARTDMTENELSDQGQVYDAVQASDAEQMNVETTESVAEETITEKPKEGIILNIVENSWVEIKDRNGKTLLSRVLQAGDEYFVPDRPDLSISIGNAGGVQFEIDGQKLGSLGESGQVRRSLPLDSAYLKKNFTP